ncbi:MAG: hypothetical protein LBP35_01030 [Candidatus Ancillula trichonymphae]|jgi:hypothetical protein|nr:hypothetical protein [Candidatus Ancillula trichonymphae]
MEDLVRRILRITELSATILLMVWKAIVRSLLSFAHNTGVARERLLMPPYGVDDKEERHVEVEITYSVVDQKLTLKFTCTKDHLDESTGTKETNISSYIGVVAPNNMVDLAFTSGTQGWHAEHKIKFEQLQIYWFPNFAHGKWCQGECCKNC